MKKSIQALVIAAVAIAAVALTGCTSVPGTIMDKSKPIDPHGYTVVKPEVSATEAMVNILGFNVSDLRGSPSRRMYQACLAQTKGEADALIEYSTDIKTLNLGIINVMWFTMTGTAVKTK